MKTRIAIALQTAGSTAQAAAELERIVREIPADPRFDPERRAAQSVLASLRRPTP